MEPARYIFLKLRIPQNKTETWNQQMLMGQH